MSAGKSLSSLVAASGSGIAVYTGTVTSYREDGMVNLIAEGGRYFGVPCSDTYTNRLAGDRVKMVSDGSAQYVLGRIGPDSTFPVPGVLPSYSRTYSAIDYGYQDTRGDQIGCSGRPGDTTPKINAWSYYTGSQNDLTVAAKVSGTTGATLILTRKSDPHGDEGPAPLNILPHNYDDLPGSTVSAFSPVTGLTPLRGSLELGEMVSITIPADWFAAMKTTTPTVRGVACAPVQDDSGDLAYAQFSLIAGRIKVY